MGDCPHVQQLREYLYQRELCVELSVYHMEGYQILGTVQREKEWVNVSVLVKPVCISTQMGRCKC